MPGKVYVGFTILSVFSVFQVSASAEKLTGRTPRDAPTQLTVDSTLIAAHTPTRRYIRSYPYSHYQ